jgi:2-(1,2-epoxy-1,2-dihydrophenyl)acetyl-CoA isomerase
MAVQPTRSLGLAKRHYRRSLEADYNTMLREEMAGQALNTTTADRDELAAAAREGRAPVFKGD